MRTVPALALLAWLATGVAGSSQQPRAENSSVREVLTTSTDRDALERAASALARSNHPRDLAFLEELLRDPGFLARLDDLTTFTTRHLSRVMAALGEHPRPQTAEICLALAEDPVFLAEGDRKSFLLELLAKVKPMSQKTAAVFQHANDEGYFAFNARLLTSNASPRALALFESMMLDKNMSVESRVQCLHVSVVPHRIELLILRAADRILARASERAILEGVIESLFDFKQQWFGLESNISEPPAWRRASVEGLRFGLRMADTALAHNELNSELRETVRRSRQTIMQVLTGRKK